MAGIAHDFDDGPIDLDGALDFAEFLFGSRTIKNRRKVYRLANKRGSTLPVIRQGNRLLGRTVSVRRWLKEQEGA